MLTPKWDDSMSTSKTTQSDLDSKRLIVITSYNSAQYQVEEIMWDETPNSVEFLYKHVDEFTKQKKEAKVTLYDYMQLRYKITLAPWELKQPVLKLSQRG